MIFAKLCCGGFGGVLEVEVVEESLEESLSR